MRDQTCVELLQWALPRLRMQWRGFRKVRRQVCKRIVRRMQDLELRGTEEYRAYLDAQPEEWSVLDRLCRITISRFYRDRGVFDALRGLVAELADRASARRDGELRAWSAGCASGEEAYTLTILWQEDLRPRFPDLRLRVVGTDVDADMLRRARRGRYGPGTLKDLPPEWRRAAFERLKDGSEPYRVRPLYRDGIDWKRQDIRAAMPRGPFDLVLCRNLAFTYFEELLQQACLRKIAARIRPGGLLVVGKHERLPPHDEPLEPVDERLGIYRRI